MTDEYDLSAEIDGVIEKADKVALAHRHEADGVSDTVRELIFCIRYLRNESRSNAKLAEVDKAELQRENERVTAIAREATNKLYKLGVAISSVMKEPTNVRPVPTQEPSVADEGAGAS